MNENKLYSPFLLIEKVFGTFFIILSLIPIPFVGTAIQVPFMFVLANLGLVDRHASSASASNLYIVGVAIILLICGTYLVIAKKNFSNYRLIWSIVRIIFYILIILAYGFQFFV